MKGGIPPWRLPWQFTNNMTTAYNGVPALKSSANLNDTYVTRTLIEDNTKILEGPWEIADGIGSGLIFLPLVSMIQIIAIVHNFSRKYL